MGKKTAECAIMSQLFLNDKNSKNIQKITRNGKKVQVPTPMQLH